MGKPINLKGNLYSKVVDRMRLFRNDFPAEKGWAVLTEPINLSNEAVVFEVKINNPEGVTVATGFSNNILGRDKALEKAETVAIGRAIANFNPKYGGDAHEFASEEEMQKFQENQNITKEHDELFPKKIAVDLEPIVTENDGATLWPFNGKNKDKPIADFNIPTCVWYLENFDRLKDPQYKAYKDMLQNRVNTSV